MMECLILGDSIAVGVQSFKRECISYARSGWNSKQWNKEYLRRDLTARNVIISLGSNDHIGFNTFDELEKLRNQVVAERVYWVLPAIKPDVQAIIMKIATTHGDVILPIQGLQPDGVHPTWKGYKDIAERIK